MRAIIELTIAVAALIGAGKYSAEYLLLQMKTAVAEKVQEQSRRSLRSMTEDMISKTKWATRESNPGPLGCELLALTNNLQ